MKKILLPLFGLALTVGNVLAEGEPAAPLDFTEAAGTLAGYVGIAALAGVTVMLAMYGIKIMKRVFKSTAG